ncbi:hypothetical protein GOBAR_DD04188 [Gossypium barbadense]|nr:hypothetical protein GOBAR_DD04188 [Gossypium barbadense]
MGVEKHVISTTRLKWTVVESTDATFFDVVGVARDDGLPDDAKRGDRVQFNKPKLKIGTFQFKFGKWAT